MPKLIFMIRLRSKIYNYFFNLNLKFFGKKYNHFISRTLLTQTFDAVLSQNNVNRNLGNHTVYFLKGNEPRLLSEEQQKQIAGFVAKDSLSSSFLVYNPAEALRRITNWKNSLPWIQPHYAIKSCPSMDLIKDLASQGAGMDCASRAEIEQALLAGVSLE